jgi:hypothetical protein
MYVCMYVCRVEPLWCNVRHGGDQRRPHVRTYIFIHSFIHIHTYVHLYTYTCTIVFVLLFVYTFACMYL